jgi:hypothetical protein
MKSMVFSWKNCFIGNILHRKSLKSHILNQRKLGKNPSTFADVDARRARFIRRNGELKRALSVHTSIVISGTSKRLCSVIEDVVATMTDDGKSTVILRVITT